MSKTGSSGPVNIKKVRVALQARSRPPALRILQRVTVVTVTSLVVFRYRTLKKQILGPITELRMHHYVEQLKISRKLGSLLMRRK